jgi:type I restriction enzyme, S subunit
MIMNKRHIKEQSTLYAPSFVESWQEQSLYPLAEWINGMAFRDFHFTPKGKPVVKIAEIKNGISKQTKFTDQQYDDIYFLKKRDMLFCWSGQPETSIDVFWWSGPEGWLNQHIFKVIPKIESKLFLFYLLKYLKPNFVQIAINKQTTGLGHVTKGDLQRFVVKLPTDKEQSAVADVLSSLDNKIELLREQNKTLEATAQEIYKEWFLNFNFPGATDKTVDTELGEIPEGWRVGNLIEKGVSEFVKTNIEDFEGIKDYVETANVNLSDFIGDFEKISHTERPSRANMQPVANSIWFARMAESRKYLLFQVRDEQDLQTKVLSTGFAGIKCVIDYLYFYWCFVLSSLFNNYKNQFAEGAVQVAISNGGIQRILLVLPPKELARKFTKTVESFFVKISDNKQQIKTLSSLRDILLPKLMKGEIRAKGFEG